MKVLIGCEQSGIVRDAFNAAGHDAWSCDLLTAETPSNRHIVGDVRDVMHWDDWDLLCVMHPPCTRLCNAGARWLTGKRLPKNAGPGYPADWDSYSDEMKRAWLWLDLQRGAQLFSDCWNTHIPLVAVENPVMHKHAKARIEGYVPFAQSVQPWEFGTDEDGPDNEKKRTCFWLRGLPNLVPTGTLDGSTARDSVHKALPGPDRWKERSRFFPGLAAAMADQWGGAALQTKRAA